MYMYLYRGTSSVKSILKTRTNTKVDIQKYGLRFIFI